MTLAAVRVLVEPGGRHAVDRFAVRTNKVEGIVHDSSWSGCNKQADGDGVRLFKLNHAVAGC